MKPCQAIQAPKNIEASNASYELLFWRRGSRVRISGVGKWMYGYYRFLIGGYTDFLSLGSEESGGRVYFTI